MAVLLTYHKLVERDEKTVQMHWKVSSMLLLILCIFFSFGVAITLHNIINVFDNRCILGAQIKMKLLPPEEVEMDQSTDNSTSEFTSSTGKLSEVFNQSYSNFIAAEGKNEFSLSDIKYLAEHTIDLQETIWGSQTTCDYAIYIPLFQCLFSVLMVVMFAICGRGGKADQNAFLPQPWRIVTPALVFNFIMTILSIVSTSMIEGGLSKFCKSLTEETPEVGCGVAMNHFMLSPYEKVHVPPSVERQMLTSFGFVNLTFWIMSVAVIIARILFVVDFQLIRVTVKTLGQDKNKKKVDENKEVKFDAGNDEFDSKC